MTLSGSGLPRVAPELEKGFAMSVPVNTCFFSPEDTTTVKQLHSDMATGRRTTSFFFGAVGAARLNLPYTRDALTAIGH